MGKGAPARRGGNIGPLRGPRCGRHSFHRQKKVCASCGFGATAHRRRYDWAKLR